MLKYSTDREILTQAHQWLEQGHRPALVTVAQTWGSSPRPVGSLMLMREDGLYHGSVSGGCVEADLTERYQSGQLGKHYPTLIDYGVNRVAASRLGLPCGGRLELLVEVLDNTAQLNTLLNAMTQQQLLTRRVCLQTGEVSLHSALANDDVDYTSHYFSKTFGPRWQLLLIGAGHLSEYVAHIALMMNYHVIVCDPRESATDNKAFDACERVQSMPDDAVRHYANHPRSLVVALTHDPKLDDMALLEALVCPTFYVGAIGSQLNCEKRRERLATLGLSEKQLQRLHAPIGLPIGSHSPPEIAVSIMAQITALRHQASLESKKTINAA